jgi:photosystem II stability/assembly factor-like uncharacterized protein
MIHSKWRLLLAFGVLLALSTTSAADPESAALDDLQVIRTGFVHDSLFGLTFTGSHGIAVGDHGVLLESHDGGETWLVDEALDIEQALLTVTTAGERALIAGQEGIVLTREGSGPWQAQDSGATERILSVAMADNGLTMAAGGFGTLLRSKDFGATWETLLLSWEEYLEDPGYEPHLYDVEFNADGHILLAGEFGMILISRDDGDSWEQRNASDESIFGMTILASGLGLAVGQNGYVLRTVDGGENWARVEIPSNANLLDAWLSDSGEAITVGIRALLSSEDRGQSWTLSESSAVTRAWYTTLAASEVNATKENTGGVRRVFMAGLLGMIVEVNPRQHGSSDGENP